MTPPVSAGTVDLQVHSTASDGAVHPGEIPRLAAAAGLVAFALTDHDSVNGVALAVAAADGLGVRVIPGVELSAVYEGRELHLLGLHLDVLESLERALATFQAQRAERGVAIVARLDALGVRISMDDVMRQAGSAALGRPHIARALIAAGVCRDFREAFDRYLGAGRPAFVAKPVLHVRDAIAHVHDAGALAVWAHPGRDGTRAAVEDLAGLGLDGVEVLHPGHSSEDVARLGTLAEAFGLVPSGGSDWHGETTGTRTLGAMKVPVEWLERQEERVAHRRSAGRV